MTRTSTLIKVFDYPVVDWLRVESRFRRRMGVGLGVEYFISWSPWSNEPEISNLGKVRQTRRHWTNCKNVECFLEDIKDVKVKRGPNGRYPGEIDLSTIMRVIRKGILSWERTQKVYKSGQV